MYTILVAVYVHQYCLVTHRVDVCIWCSGPRQGHDTARQLVHVGANCMVNSILTGFLYIYIHLVPWISYIFYVEADHLTSALYNAAVRCTRCFRYIFPEHSGQHYVTAGLDN